MKKLLFIICAAVCLAGCGNDNEPTPPTNNNTNTSTNTSTPSKPSTPSTPSTPSIPDTNTPIKQPENNTQIPTQPTNPKPEIPEKITLNLVNNSSLYEYVFRVSGKDYVVPKNSYKTLILDNIKHSASVKNTEGWPTSGRYVGLPLTKDLWYNDYIPDNHSFYTHEKNSIVIRNRTNDQLKIVINGGNFIAPFLVEPGDTHSIEVDLGFYNIKAYEMDYFLFQDTYEYDFAILEPETLCLPTFNE